METSRIVFHGGAGKVTGANIEERTANVRLLLDCGIEQGAHVCEECSYDPFPYKVDEIDALIVSHAHMDHIGRIPRLVKEGYRGPIYMTTPTKDLSVIMWQDAVRILKDEADKAGREALYKEEDVHGAVSLIKGVSYHEEVSISEGVSFRFLDAGHILGSAIIELSLPDGVLAYTGDLGNTASPLLKKTESLERADWLITESVYGDRVHQSFDESIKILQKAIADTVLRGGTLLIPSFSIERTQVLLHEISNLFSEKKIPEVPVFLDSPLAIAVTEVYEASHAFFSEDAQKEVLKEGSIFTFPFLKFVAHHGDSAKITRMSGPKVIIAGAGMSTGGRIRAHEKHLLPDAKNMILFVGYQAPGGLGRRIQDGAKKVTIDRVVTPVRAEVRTVSGFSAHADRNMLLDTVASAEKARTVFVALGEPDSASFIAQRIHDFLGKKAIVPEEGKEYSLT